MHTLERVWVLERTCIGDKNLGYIRDSILMGFESTSGTWVTIQLIMFTVLNFIITLLLALLSQALQEPTFSGMYANLCRVMGHIEVELPDPERPSMVDVTTFKRILLTKCQQEFDKGMKEIARLWEDIGQLSLVSASSPLHFADSAFSISSEIIPFHIMLSQQ